MLADSTPVGQYTLAHYLAGRCHLFALALHQVTDLPLAVWLDEEAWFEDLVDPIPALDHAFCLHPEDSAAGIDANGSRDLDDIEADYASGSTAPLLLTGDAARALLIDWIGVGRLNGFDPGEQDALSTFIDTHRLALTAMPVEPDYSSPGLGGP